MFVAAPLDSHRPRARVLATPLAALLPLLAVGCAGTSSPSAEPPRERRTEAETLAVAEAEVRRTGFCGDTESPRGPATVSGHHALPDGSMLVMVRCDFFAYQGRYRLARLFPNGALGSVSIVVPDEPALDGLVDRSESLAGDLVGVPEMDPTSGDVTVLCKARGPGDCGVYATFDHEGGALSLSVARALTCEASDAAAARGEDARLGPDWPIVWPR